jgi:hypothetical protein
MMMDGAQNAENTVNIRPGVSMLSVLRHLNYKSWFALAEFVDNSVQSYLSDRTRLQALHGKDFKLCIKISIDPTPPARITIRDNAGGIKLNDFPRAFRPAAIPPDRSGLSEFGMGMKSAACWFAPQWSVRTKALGDPLGRLVRFDVAQIVNDQIEELEITSQPIDQDWHFTEVTLENLYHVPVKKTIGKIKEHLADIYRVFIREGWLELKLGNDPLVPEEPTILYASYAKAPQESPRLWRKEIDFDLGGEQRVKGFAALREPGNYARTGFALFRRGRLIQGSGDEGYKPDMIFGQHGSFRSLRLFGELHLDGFEVSHTKDGFRWDENEQPFLDLLKEHLDDSEMPLLRQADNYRALAARADRERAAKEAVGRTADILAEELPDTIEVVADHAPVETQHTELPSTPTLASREVTLGFKGETWRIRIELSDDPSEGDWLSLSDVVPSASSERLIEIRVSYTHPFMMRFASRGGEDLEVMLRMAAALALAEALARNNGVKMAGTVRRNFNEILRDALSAADREKSK